MVTFAYSGGSWAHLGMGAGLFRARATFRESVIASCELLGGPEGRAVERTFADPVSAEPLSYELSLCAIAILQIAQTDLWHEEGVRPDATLGVSLGEIGAAYAAGALTREEAVRIAAAVSRASDRAPYGVVLSVAMGAREAQRTAHQAPDAVTYIGTVHPNLSMLLCESDARAAVRERLDGAVVEEFPEGRCFHTAQMVEARSALFSEVRDVVPRQTEIPVYLASAGGEAPGDRLDARFWNWMLRNPFHLDEAVQAAASRGLGTVVGIGPAERMGPWLAGAVGADELRFVPSAAVGADDEVAWKAAVAAARRRRLVMPPLRHRRSHAPADPVVVRDFEGVRHVLTSDEFSTATYAAIDEELLSRDAPDHAAPRRAATAALARRAPEQAAEHARAAARRLIDPLLGRTEFDLVAEFATPLAEEVLGEVIGLSGEPLERFARATRDDNPHGTRERIRRALDALDPPPALVDELSETWDFDPARSKRLVGFLWEAGTASVVNSIAAAALELDRDHVLRGRLAADRALLDGFVEEVVRLHPPRVRRQVKAPTRIGEARVEAGARVEPSLRDANRDPAHFPDPEAVDPDRPVRHLGFGAGRHRCVGARLARAEIRAAVDALLSAMPAFEILDPLADLRSWDDLGSRALLVAPRPG